MSLLIGVGSLWRQYISPDNLVPGGNNSVAQAGHGSDCQAPGVIQTSAGAALTNAVFTNCSQPSNTYSHSAGTEAIKIKGLPPVQPLSGQVQ